MKSVQLSELGPVAEEVRKGETVEVRDGDEVVARVVPLGQTLEERIAELTKQGLIRPPLTNEPFPSDFFTRPLPKAEESVLEQLLEDRRSGR